MSIAERTDALEVIHDWDELDTPEESAEVEPQEDATRPDPEVTTQDHRPQQEQEAPATPVAADQQQPNPFEQQLAEARAEQARLQKMITDREWSDRGRVEKLEKELKQRDERLGALETERANADQFLTSVAAQRKQQFLANGDQIGAQNVDLALENELLKRQTAREREDRQIAERHAQELTEGQRQAEQMQRGRQVQAAFIPTMEAEARAAAAQFGLDADETADLVAFTTPKSLRHLALNAPPEVLGQLAIQQYEVIIERATALQARKVRRNQEAFDTTRETNSGGATRDLDKEFADASDDEAVEMLMGGYVPPQPGKRRR
jgi:hypothetical protein